MVETGRCSPRTKSRVPDGVTVTTTPGVAKPRKLTKMVVEGLSNEVFVYNNSLVNLVRGLCERVYHVESGGTFVPPPKPGKYAFARMREFATQVVDRCGRSTRVSYDSFVAMYTGRKATIYRNAVASLHIRPLRPADAYLSTFIKAEKVVPTLSKPWPAPRVIQPRTPRFNVEVGRFLKPLEHKIYKAIDKVWGEPTVMKGYTVERVAKILHCKWEGFRRPVAIGLDASRFDQHVSAEALRWEHSVYEACTAPHERDKLHHLLAQQLTNTGYARAHDGKVKYRVHGCRMSGDMNTALGNVLIMCGLVWTYLKARSITGKMINNGDDCTVIMEECDVGRFTKGLQEWFVGFGFTMKVEPPVRVFEQIEFCRMHPVWAGNGWVMVRTCGDALKRDLCTLLPTTGRMAARKWLSMIGTCGVSLTHGVPVVNTLYRRLKAMGPESNMAQDTWMLNSGFARLQSERDDTPVTPEARYSFWLAFGITPDAQEQLETMPLGCEWAPGVSALAGVTYNVLLNDKI